MKQKKPPKAYQQQLLIAKIKCFCDRVWFDAKFKTEVTALEGNLLDPKIPVTGL